MYKRKCNLLILIILIISIVYIIFTLLIVDTIRPLGQLLFLKQFMILGILYLIVLPIVSMILGNLYFHITNKKEWFSWLKIPEYYDDIFTIISIFPFLFLIFEIGIFFAFYTKLYKMNEIIVLIILSIIAGIIFALMQIFIRKIFRIRNL